MENKVRKDALLVNAVMHSLTENNRKLLRRLKLRKETGRRYDMTKQRREAMQEMEQKAIWTVQEYYIRHNIQDEDYAVTAKAILYSEDLLSL